MMMLLLMAGLGAFVGGLVAILFGIPVKEFSFGNTLIVVGAMAACTGLIIIALAVVVGELKTIARRVGSRALAEVRPREGLAAALPDSDEDEFIFPRDPSTPPDEEGFESAAPPISVRNGPNASRAPQNGQSEPDPVEGAPKARRNLMFASASRKERERTQTRPSEVSPVPPPLPLQPPPADIGEPQPPNLDDSRSRQERIRPPDPPPQRRGSRGPATFTEPNAGADAPLVRNVDQKPVTVLKSGVVDGMAYSLYSDGSIEAQMPEGLMRFASIDELRSHLDHRPG